VAPNARIAASIVVAGLVAGCSDELAMPTLQEKWKKVQALKVEESTVDELTAKLGAPYRSSDGETKRSRFWYPFEGVTRDGKPKTAPMLIVILSDNGEIISYMRSEPLVLDNGPTHIVPHDYRAKVGGHWIRRELDTATRPAD